VSSNRHIPASEYLEESERPNQEAESACCTDGVKLNHNKKRSDQTSSPTQPRYIFKVQGLDCAEEVATLRRGVGPLVGGEDQLTFDVLNGRMMVLEDAAQVSAEEVCEAVRKTGMTAVEWRKDDEDSKRVSEKHRRTQAWLTTLSGLSILGGLTLHVWLSGGFGEALKLFAGHDGHVMPIPELMSYALAIGLGGRYVIVKAWYAARALRADMNLLMAIAVIGAITIGEWFEAATVTFLFALSLLLESWSVDRARRAIASLLDLAPPVARLRLSSGVEEEVPVDQVSIGSRIVVKPGERIPLDGRVIYGSSAANQAPITGESMPVSKTVGDDVFAGTINGEGALLLLSTKAAQDTTLARIIRQIENAQSRRASSEQWVEKFARIYTPAVILLAIAIFVLPPLLFGEAWESWLYRALVLLVIACPCALVISTPVSIVSALAASARKGVLVKGGTYIEQPARLKAIAFDKTGTLTQGRPEVVGVVPLNGHTEEELLERAVALEALSTHPLAEAIIGYAEKAGLDTTQADGVQVLPGKGVVGRFRGEEFWLGSHRYLVERGQETPDVKARTEKFEQGGTTVIVVGNQNHVCGLIAMADKVREDARQMIEDLRRNGIEHIVMLTGDNWVTAQSIAREVGIDEVHAELLPEDKVAAVETLVSNYGTVAMVGDGINDAPAMARANFGIAMGAMGSDAAIETADIALMTDDISKLPWLIDHSRRTLAIIRENILFSLCVKAVFVILTFAGFATLWGAIAADVGASLLVVANALRLLRLKQTPSRGLSGEERALGAITHGH
jgi:Zn2+/Cd2+-exporting ATPase